METRAIVMTGRGGPEVLEGASIALDWPKAGSALVRLKCAGVNPADVYFRTMGPYVGEARGCVLGHDGAGIIEAVGAGVERVAPGDAVAFCHGGIGGAPGTYAEYAVVPEFVLVKIPKALGFDQAAALPLVMITTFEALIERARIAEGERVLIHAGAGGTGHIAVQLAKLRGGRVAATVSTGAKAKFVEALGCERPILYPDEDFVEAVRGWSAGRGVDVAFDNVGGETARRTLSVMAPYGRFASLMGVPSDTENLDAFIGNVTIINVEMLMPMVRGLKDRLAAQAGMVGQGLAWLADGTLKLHISARYPLGAAAEAHRRLEAGGVTGKIVLTMDR